MLLQEAGFRCVILEANTLCFGTTGGTTAHLNTILDTPYSTIVKNFGQKKASLVARAVEEAIGLIRSNCEKYSIAADLEKQTAYLFAQTDEQAAELEEIRKASDEVGLRLEYTGHIPIEIKMQKALAVDDRAKFHPTRYVLGMARAFQDMGGRIIWGYDRLV